MSTAAAIIVFAIIVLVTMTGIGGYVIGRTHATDDAAKKTIKEDKRLHETLVDLKVDVLFMSELLIFTQSRSFNYREVAIEAIKILSTNDPRKEDLKRKLQDIDGKVQKKVTEIESEKG